MKVLNGILVLMLFTGIIIVVVAQYLQCPPAKVEYRYIPRNLEQQLKDNNFDKDMFRTVFGDGDVWLESVQDSKINNNSYMPALSGFGY
jgi:hypothetical protein